MWAGDLPARPAWRTSVDGHAIAAHDRDKAALVGVADLRKDLLDGQRWDLLVKEAVGTVADIEFHPGRTGRDIDDFAAEEDGGRFLCVAFAHDSYIEDAASKCFEGDAREDVAPFAVFIRDANLCVRDLRQARDDRNRAVDSAPIQDRAGVDVAWRAHVRR